MILNRGAHVLNDTITVKQMLNFTERLTNIQKRRRNKEFEKNQNDLQIFWRNTVPGHVDCDNALEPRKQQDHNHLISNSNSNNNSNSDSYDKQSKEYKEFKWHMIKPQNKMMLDILKASHGLKFHFIDAYAVSIDRQDRHQGGMDCLHYCLPGPPDLWTSIFVYKLKKLWESM